MPIQSYECDLSRVGVGTWALGGDNWAWGWGPQVSEDSRSTLIAAAKLGLNWIDTAPIYGLGNAEEAIAEASAHLPYSERPRVFTKCGFIWDSLGRIRHDLRPRSLRGQIDDSLRRLKVDRLDACQIHWPVASNGMSACPLEETIAALAELKSEGRIAKIGICNATSEQLEVAFASGPIDIVQVPFSMINRGELADIADACEGRDILLLGYSPFESGLLAGSMTRARAKGFPKTDWRRNKADSFKEPSLTRALALMDEVKALAANAGLTPGSLVLAWTLAQQALSCVIVGLRKPKQVADAVAWIDAKVPPAVMEAMNGLAQSNLEHSGPRS